MQVPLSPAPNTSGCPQPLRAPSPLLRQPPQPPPAAELAPFVPGPAPSAASLRTEPIQGKAPLRRQHRHRRGSGRGRVRAALTWPSRRCPGAGRLRQGGGTDGQPQPERPRPARRGSGARGRAGQRESPGSSPGRSPGRARAAPAVPGAAARSLRLPAAARPEPRGFPRSPARPPGSLLMDYRDKEGSRLFPACLRAVTCRLRRHRALPTAPARREQLPPELQGGLQESTRKEIFSLAYFLLFTSRLMASLMHQHQRIMIFHHRLLPFASYTGAVRLRAKKYNWPHFLKPFTCPQTCPTFIN